MFLKMVLMFLDFSAAFMIRYDKLLWKWSLDFEGICVSQLSALALSSDSGPRPQFVFDSPQFVFTDPDL